MLSIIIVNWNVRDVLIKNLESIFNHTQGIEYEVIVVDNDSKDSSVEMINNRFRNEIEQKKLIVIDTKINNGFAKGNNIGYEKSRGEYVLFMNPDMELIENSFKKLVDYMNQNTDIDVLGTTLNYPDRTMQKTVKNLPTFLSQVLILLKLHHFFYNFKPLADYLLRDFDYNKKQEVEQLMGAFVLIRKNVLEEIGKWDEDYWLWWEDVELAYRLKKNGFKVVYAPITKIVHYESKSFEQEASLTRQKRFNKMMLIYFKKHNPWWQYFVLILLQPISLFLAWLTQVFRVKMKQQSKI